LDRNSTPDRLGVMPSIPESEHCSDNFSNQASKGVQMKTIQYDNGDKMPVLGLGTWKSNPGDVYQAVKEAIRLGYRHIDCAPIYGNEAEVGKALAESFREGVVTRGEMWITSKLWNNAHRAEDVTPAARKTLSDLQLDYLDLFLIHWPVALRPEVQFPGSGADMVSLEEMPLSATWAAMEALVDENLCRHIGVSNFSIAKLKALAGTARLKPEMNQIELHPYLQQPAMLDYCSQSGVYLTAYSPLGSGDRPAALKAQDEPVLLTDPVISAIAEKNSIPPAQVLIAWAIQRNTVVIPKSVNPERMKQNLAAAEVILSSAEMAQIAGLDKHRRYVGGEFWTQPGSPYTIASLWDE
jgi:alcohol dehydrogenase (NADP+)